MRLPSILAILALAAAPIAAQTTTRLAMLDAWRHQHRHILAVIDSATPAMLGFRPTPGVRSFAEQINHVSEVAARIITRAVAGRPFPAELFADSAVYLHDRDRLRQQTDRVFTLVIGALTSTTDDDLAAEEKAFGGSMPRWRWNLTALQHSAWTLGQTIPYLRLNGRTPPMFTPF
jgi:hypothetical protein